MNSVTRHEPASGQADLPVRMVRNDLDAIPRFELQPGYGLRWYEPGDELRWLRIQRECEGYGELSDDLFRRQFGEDDAVLARRMCFIFRDDGLPIATNAAWFGRWRGRDYGRVHWVAISREAQGRGLSHPLMSAVCARLHELGHDQAYLTTNTLRLRAILLCQRFGFAPWWETEEEARAWRSVAEKCEEFGRTLDLREPYR